MWVMALVLIAIIAAAILILLTGTKVKINSRGIKMGFCTYTNEDIRRHHFSVKICHKSPAEYDSELNAFIPRAGAPPSHRPKWIVELEVFDSNGQHIRKHFFQKPNERAAKKLAAELTRGLDSKRELFG